MNKDKKPLRVLVSGGGTGGHIFPAVSIANAVRRRHPDAEILFVGALGRMEMERVPAAGYEIVGLPVAGFDRRRLWRNFSVIVKLMRSLRKARKVLRDFRPDIAIGVGGSLGARTINQSIAGSLDKILSTGTQVLWQTGKLYIDECQTAAEPHKDVKATAFISDMAMAYRAADLVVARAGACTISELQLLGVPAVLVPSPNVAEDHQRKNALALADRDAAVMVLDADAPDQLATVVAELLADAPRRELLARNVAAMALRESDERIVDAIDRVVAQS